MSIFDDYDRFDPYAIAPLFREDHGPGFLPGMRADSSRIRDRVPLSDLKEAAKSWLPDSAPVRETKVRPEKLELVVVTPEEQPVSDLELVTEDTDGNEVKLVTNELGVAVAEVHINGNYWVRFAAPPPVLPKRPELPLFGKDGKPGKIYSQRLPPSAEGFSARTDALTRIVLDRPCVTEVIIDGYAQGSAVLRWGGMRPRIDGTVATTRGALRLALWAARGRTLCVAGHADPAGSDVDNHGLSEARATSVELFARGDLDAWADHAAAHASDLDLQCALVACHTILGLGPVGLEDDEALDAAHKEIRLGAGLADDAPVGRDDWRAIADLYDFDLATFMQTNVAGLAEIRSAIRWTSPGILALGERFPKPEGELLDLVGLPALPHRRASLLVFDDTSLPQAAVDADGESVYDGTYTRTIVPVPGEVLVTIRVDTAKREPISRGRAWVSVGALGAAEHTAHFDGTIRFLTLAGDRIRVLKAFDGDGLGTIVDGGVEDPGGLL